MKHIFNKSYFIRGVPKTDEWLGWTDGYSIITGVAIPFIVENNEVIKPVTAEQIYHVLKDEYVPFEEGTSVEFVKTPLATGISQNLIIIDYMNLDYFDLWVHFGLQKLFKVRFLPSRRIGIYDTKFNLIGFFAILRYDAWFQPNQQFLKELNTEHD